MNSPIIIALLGSVATIVVYMIAGNISNKWLKGSVQVFSIILGILVAGAISSDPGVSAIAGKYFFYIMVVVAIGSKLFGKKNA